MFTGLIEEIGTVQSIQKTTNSARLVISAARILEDVSIGDSINTNGVCLTAAETAESHFCADVMAETLRSTALGSLKAGDRVNLERALRLGDRLGGHMVSGHIDGTGIIQSKKTEAHAVRLSIQTPEDVFRYMIPKGSVAVDGISLTIAHVSPPYIEVSIVLHTSQATALLDKAPGAAVNLECDIIGKYIEQFTRTDKKAGSGSKDSVTLQDLQKHGFA